jgi:hypothetical protein
MSTRTSRVFRVYRTSMEGGVWKLWGDGPEGFSGRFSGTSSDDGNSLSGGIRGAAPPGCPSRPGDIESDATVALDVLLNEAGDLLRHTLSFP